MEVGGAGEKGGGKMETPVFEKQLKLIKKRKDKNEWALELRDK